MISVAPVIDKGVTLDTTVTLIKIVLLACVPEVHLSVRARGTSTYEEECLRCDDLRLSRVVGLECHIHVNTTYIGNFRK